MTDDEFKNAAITILGSMSGALIHLTITLTEQSEDRNQALYGLCCANELVSEKVKKLIKEQEKQQ